MKNETTSVVDIQPNAAKLIDSMRHVGYDNYSAVMDIIDNSLDAGAGTCHVWWKQEKGSPTIIIADTGSGMDADSLNQAMRLGSLGEKNPETDLGRFGMGLTTATLSLCRKVVILTKTETGELLRGATDIDEMIAENKFKMEVGGITQDDKSGTVIQLQKVDRLTNANLSVASDILRKKVSRVFRVFLENKRNIFINGKKAEAVNPLDPIPGQPSRIILDETFLYPLNGKDAEGEMVRLKLAFLPEVSDESARDYDFNQAGQGFYVLRNLREIVDASTLGLFTKHPSLNRFRAEIQVSGKMDEAIQIDFAKSRANLVQSLADKINALVKPHINYIRKNHAKDNTRSKIDKVQHGESEQEIASRKWLPVRNPPPERSGKQKQNRPPGLGKKNRQNFAGFVGSRRLTSAGRGSCMRPIPTGRLSWCNLTPRTRSMRG